MYRGLVGLLFVLLFPAMLWSQEERIYTHHSDIVVDISGSIRVTEKIRVYTDGDLFKRGITRSLPSTRIDADGKRIKVDYDIIAVSKNGAEESFFTEKEGGFLTIYVGSKDVMLNPGYYDYEIVYEAVGQLGFYEGFDELGWNVNGESDRPVDLVSCEIHLPNNAEILSHRCYTGAIGGTDSNCNSESFGNGIFKASATNLHPNEMLTVYVGFEKGVVNEPIVKETLASKILSFLDGIGLWFVNLIVIVPLFFYYMTTWRKHGANPPKPVVVPQFEPPHNLSPASVGMIKDEFFDSGIVTTSIINLAVKGFLRIEEVERKGIMKLSGKRYNLIKLKDIDDSLPSEERLIMTTLFVDTDSVTLGGKYNKAVESMMSKYRLDMQAQHSTLISEGRNYKYRVLPWFVLIIYIGLLFVFGRNEPMELYVALFSFMIPTFFGVAFLYIIYSLIRKRKPKKILSISLGVAVVVSVLGVFTYFPINRMSSTAIALLIGLLFVLVGHLIYSYMIVSPSEEKLQLQADIEGLKMYISMAEEKQLQYFNPPEVTPEVFEKLLPYAIALKVDKIWGDKFEKTLLKSMQTSDVSYVPLWYAGSAMRPANIGGSMKRSLASGLQQSATNPKSTSGNNWGSGSFGGGSVGGGGGGGRTGGW